MANSFDRHTLCNSLFTENSSRKKCIGYFYDFFFRHLSPELRLADNAGVGPWQRTQSHGGEPNWEGVLDGHEEQQPAAVCGQGQRNPSTQDRVQRPRPVRPLLRLDTSPSLSDRGIVLHGPTVSHACGTFMKCAYIQVYFYCRYIDSRHTDYVRGLAWRSDKLYTCGWDHQVFCHDIPAANI